MSPEENKEQFSNYEFKVQNSTLEVQSSKFRVPTSRITHLDHDFSRRERGEAQRNVRRKNRQFISSLRALRLRASLCIHLFSERFGRGMSGKGMGKSLFGLIPLPIISLPNIPRHPFALKR